MPRVSISMNQYYRRRYNYPSSQRRYCKYRNILVLTISGLGLVYLFLLWRIQKFPTNNNVPISSSSSSSSTIITKSLQGTDDEEEEEQESTFFIRLWKYLFTSSMMMKKEKEDTKKMMTTTFTEVIYPSIYIYKYIDGLITLHNNNNDDNYNPPMVGMDNSNPSLLSITNYDDTYPLFPLPLPSSSSTMLPLSKDTYHSFLWTNRTSLSSSKSVTRSRLYAHFTSIETSNSFHPYHRQRKNDPSFFSTGSSVQSPLNHRLFTSLPSLNSRAVDTFTTFCGRIHDPCLIHSTPRTCVENELCGWCASTDLCIDRLLPSSVTYCPHDEPLYILYTSAFLHPYPSFSSDDDTREEKKFHPDADGEITRVGKPDKDSLPPDYSTINDEEEKAKEEEIGDGIIDDYGNNLQEWIPSYFRQRQSSSSSSLSSSSTVPTTSIYAGILDYATGTVPQFTIPLHTEKTVPSECTVFISQSQPYRLQHFDTSFSRPQPNNADETSSFGSKIPFHFWTDTAPRITRIAQSNNHQFRTLNTHYWIQEYSFKDKDNTSGTTYHPHSEKHYRFFYNSSYWSIYQSLSRFCPRTLNYIPPPPSSMNSLPHFYTICYPQYTNPVASLHTVWSMYDILGKEFATLPHITASYVKLALWNMSTKQVIPWDTAIKIGTKVPLITSNPLARYTNDRLYYQFLLYESIYRSTQWKDEEDGYNDSNDEKKKLNALDRRWFRFDLSRYGLETIIHLWQKYALTLSVRQIEEALEHPYDVFRGSRVRKSSSSSSTTIATTGHYNLFYAIGMRYKDYSYGTLLNKGIIKNPSMYTKWIAKEVTQVLYAYGTRSLVSYLLLSTGLVTFLPSTPLITIISRTQKRRLRNEEELLTMVQSTFQLPVVSVIIEKLSLKEQIQLFRQTTLLIGVHGSGLINSQFLTSGTAVFQLLPYGMGNPNTYSLPLSSLNSNYRSYPWKDGTDKGQRYYRTIADKYGIDYYEMSNIYSNTSIFYGDLIMLLAQEKVITPPYSSELVNDQVDTAIHQGVSCCSDNIFYHYWINQDFSVNIPDTIEAIQYILNTNRVNKLLRG